MPTNATQDKVEEQVKPVVYQVFTRLFGNTKDTNMPWGTESQNGVGKFSDFTPQALAGIKQLGVSHIWYTGVPHHAVIADYSAIGLGLDDPDVVKGRAGSPYAVKDYYSVNPDLADNPSHRLQEFEALIDRTHAAGMKVIIDIVPNHVARNYQSTTKPEGVSDFGEHDDTTREYTRDNNFYYIPNTPFQVPDGAVTLAGETNDLADGHFHEFPAKWTGNGSRLAQPDKNDWYETVKVNYGVRPDGSYDFPLLPKNYNELGHSKHFEFWSDKSLPDSWRKFEHIVHYWLDKGVDGFRYDMAEMVPVEFWSFLNSSIKHKNPDAFILAEVYNPDLYRDYIHLGKMDYLYDKVEFYDALKGVMQGRIATDALEVIQNDLQDIEQNMLHFLENHDEQRIASPEFAGDMAWGKPALVVSSLISRSPTMLYFAQDVGEDGSEDAGFGKPSRTSIFDYIGVPAHQRWMNDGKFDGAKLSTDEKALREYYVKVMQVSSRHASMRGDYESFHSKNRALKRGYTGTQYAFGRTHYKAGLIVVSSFEANKKREYPLTVPASFITKLELSNGTYPLTDLLSGVSYPMMVRNGIGSIDVALEAKSSLILEINNDL